MKRLKNYDAAPSEAEKAAATARYGEVMGKYGDMDEDALLNELVKSVTASKQNGTYDSEQMLNFMNTVAPYLNDAQKEKLAALISMIDGK
ncbi:MAG: hypothetical protein LBH24_00780 [Clostridiales bacterium]|jgi:hypothetical protein|nr:hypothetical protein [Clostridiales bacterium]